MDLDTVEDLIPAGTTDWRPGDAWLAGGTYLFSEPQRGLRRLLDLTAFDWPALSVDGDDLVVSATCTLAELADLVPRPSWTAAALVRPCCEALWGSFKIRGVATVGGNICLALPAGPMTALAAGLDATASLLAVDGTARTLPVADLVTGPASTALALGELLVSIRFDSAALRSRVTMRRISLTPLGRSAALVLARRDADGRCVVTVTASTPAPVQLRFPTVPGVAQALAELEWAQPAWYDDVHGLPAWRAAMTRRLVAEVVAELTEPGEQA